MSIWNRLFTGKKIKNEAEASLYGEGANVLMQWLGIDRKNKKAISEVTYFTCIKSWRNPWGSCR